MNHKHWAKTYELATLKIKTYEGRAGYRGSGCDTVASIEFLCVCRSKDMNHMHMSLKISNKILHPAFGLRLECYLGIAWISSSNVEIAMVINYTKPQNPRQIP